MNITFFLFLLSPVATAKKVLQTKFTTDNITIDGKLDEPIWQSTQKLLIL
jgi:ribosomal protein L31E